jgi:hypothetical protein
MSLMRFYNLLETMHAMNERLLASKKGVASRERPQPRDTRKVTKLTSISLCGRIRKEESPDLKFLHNFQTVA